ncbi:MAG: CBS domain-containing protein [Phycisphaerae bacterium]
MKLTAKDLASRPVQTIAADADLDRAIDLLDDLKIHHLPVTGRTGKCVGMISDRDLLSRVGGIHRRDRIPAHAHDDLPQHVEDIMSIPAISATETDDLADVIDKMLIHRISAIAIVKGRELWGMVTSRDILRRYLDDENIPAGKWRFQKVLETMTRDVISLRQTDSIDVAVRMFREHAIRHLPIMESGRLVGMLSDRDVRRVMGTLRAEAALEEGKAPTRISVGHVMSAELVTASAVDTLADAADRMIAYQITSLPVLEEGKLVGILTESDLMRAFARACRTDKPTTHRASG